MASRMDRYYKSELVTSGRSSKNKDLYKQIENLENYTNIEGVATIENTNEIDISKVREMIKNRENYKKQKQLNSFLKKEEPIVESEPEIIEEPKSYDIKDLLLKMEQNSKSENRVRRLDKEQYELLKSLKRVQKDDDIKKEEDELKELIDTISSSKVLKGLNDNSFDEDVDLLDDLKSDTMVGDAASIRKILEEEKKETKTNLTNPEIDKDFYTSSFGFTKRDFEDLKNINQNIKKSNKFIIVLLVVFIALIAALGIIFLLFNK